MKMLYEFWTAAASNDADLVYKVKNYNSLIARQIDSAPDQRIQCYLFCAYSFDYVMLSLRYSMKPIGHLVVCFCLLFLKSVAYLACNFLQRVRIARNAERCIS